MSIILDTPEQIEHMRAFTLAQGLALEITTGMKMSNRYSAVKVANSMGFTGKQKKPALQWVIETYKLEPTERMTKALA